MEITKEVKTDIETLIKSNLSAWKETAADSKENCECEDKEDCDDCGFMPLTVSTNNDGNEWAFQTGDNSYTGSCYGHPHWAVEYVHAESDSKDLSESICNQLDELLNS